MAFKIFQQPFHRGFFFFFAVDSYNVVLREASESDEEAVFCEVAHRMRGGVR